MKNEKNEVEDREVEFSINIQSGVNMKDKKCKQCKTDNIFKFVPSTHSVIPICPECANITLIDSDSLIQGINTRLNNKEKERKKQLRECKRSELLRFIYDLQITIAKRAREGKSDPLEDITMLAGFTEEAFKYSDPNGKVTQPTVFENLWKSYSSINELKSLKPGVLYGTVSIDREGNKYYSYNYIRRKDGIGEFGVGTRSEVEKLIKPHIDLYKEEDLKFSRSSKKKEFLEYFKEDDPLILEFISGFYCAIQSDKTKLLRLNLKWLKAVNIDILQLQELRRKYFSSPNINRSVKKTIESLEEFFGKQKADFLYQNLVASPKRPSVLPYGIEIEGSVYFVPLWTLYLESLFIAELEGEENLKNYMMINQKLLKRNVCLLFLKKCNFRSRLATKKKKMVLLNLK